MSLDGASKGPIDTWIDSEQAFRAVVLGVGNRLTNSAHNLRLTVVGTAGPGWTWMPSSRCGR